MGISSTYIRRTQTYKVYKIVVKVRDLVHGRFEVAAKDRKDAQEAGEGWAKDRGYVPGFNCDVSVMVKVADGQAVTIQVVK